MFQVKVDRIKALVELSLEGRIEVDEIRSCAAELDDVLATLQGREIRLLVDLRGLKPVAPEVAEVLRRFQERALDIGLARFAEVVDSELLALQLGRIARESGVDRVTRRFTTAADAREWLLQPGPAAAP